MPAQVTGVAGVPPSASAVLFNLTGTEAAAPTFLAATPHGGGGTSNLNVKPGRDVANAVAVEVAGDGPWARIFNSAGEVHVVMDMLGYFEGAIG